MKTRSDLSGQSLCKILSHRVSSGVKQNNLKPKKVNLARDTHKAVSLMKSFASTYYLQLKEYLKLNDFVDREFNLPFYRSTSLWPYGKFRFKNFLVVFNRF